MSNRKPKVFSLINIVIAVSLLLNVILISRMSFYKNFIYENLNRSLEDIKLDLTRAQEALDEIIITSKIDELQYRDIYFSFDNFEHGVCQVSCRI